MNKWHLLPIKSSRLFHGKSIIFHVVHFFRMHGGIEHQFFRNTTYVDLKIKKKCWKFMDFFYKNVEINLTHVPPRACFSMRPTETPNSAALLAEAIPPEPPPKTKYWKCLVTGAIFTVEIKVTQLMFFHLQTTWQAIMNWIQWNFSQSANYGW